MRRRIVSVLAMAAVIAALGGCASYYTVTDPMTNKVHYTKNLDTGRTGGIVFRDAASGDRVTVQNPEVRKINKALFRANIP